MRPTSSLVSMMLASLPLIACSGGSATDSASETGVLRAGQIFDDPRGANSGLYFLPKMVPKFPAIQGVVDLKASPTVQIDEYNPLDGKVTRTVATYTMNSGPGGETVKTNGRNYYVNFVSNAFNVSLDFRYRARVIVNGRELGFADFAISFHFGGWEWNTNLDPEQFATVEWPNALPINFVLTPCASKVCPGTACRADTCDHWTGACVAAEVKPDDTKCNDGNACTEFDVCRRGVCGGRAKTCKALDGCHVAGVCDLNTGACSNPAAANGVACNDGNLCTLTDTCVAGACVGGNVKACLGEVDVADQCHVPSCDPTDGACRVFNAPDGTSCDDKNPCTTQDACVVGGCTGTPVVCNKPPDCGKPKGTCNQASGQCDYEIDPALCMTPTKFAWLSNSGGGMISKIDTETGKVLAKFRTGPGYGSPSRCAVSLVGDLWVGNRANNTITKIANTERCVDRNKNGKIDTSTGENDIKDWTGAWGDVSGAKDECILLHTAVSWPNIPTPSDIRAITIDKFGNVYTGGYTQSSFYKVNGQTGAMMFGRQTKQGHYGGVMAKDGFIWSAQTGSGQVEKIHPITFDSWLFPTGHSLYGVAVDKDGIVWTSEYGSRFSRMNPDGSGLKVFTQRNGRCCAQGITAAANGDIYIAGSLSSNHVGRYRPDGSFLAEYTVGSGPTGVTIDFAGNIWTSDYYSSTASRINPNTGGVTQIAVGANPYNYSDMTGYIINNITK